MARLVGNELPEDLFNYLSAKSGSKFEDVILLVSVDEKSWPHVAMLSHWEVAASDKHSIKVATYADSRTTANMKRAGKATVVLVNSDMSYYVKGTPVLVKEQMEKDRDNSLFDIKVDEVYGEEMTGTKILSGIKFSKGANVEPHEQLYAELINS